MKSYALLIAFSLLCVICCPFFGATPIDPAQIMDKASADYPVFWKLRLPRAAGAFLAGAALAICGCVFQALFRNPLATPYTLGVSSGAAFGAAFYYRVWGLAGVTGYLGSLGCGLCGCGLSIICVYAITRARGGLQIPVLLLSGVIINFFFSSLTLFIQYISHAQDGLQIMRWLMGSLSGISYTSIWQLGAAAFVPLLVFTGMAPELDLLYAGEDAALSRGVDVEKMKNVIFFTGSLCVGITISVTGPIGFVGMIIPQICRMAAGYSHKRLLPAVFLTGGAFLCVCDALARFALAPAELPIGVLTSLLGAPFFFWILFRKSASANNIIQF